MDIDLEVSNNSTQAHLGSGLSANSTRVSKIESRRSIVSTHSHRNLPPSPSPERAALGFYALSYSPYISSRATYAVNLPQIRRRLTLGWRSHPPTVIPGERRNPGTPRHRQRRFLEPAPTKLGQAHVAISVSAHLYLVVSYQFYCYTRCTNPNTRTQRTRLRHGTTRRQLHRTGSGSHPPVAGGRATLPPPAGGTPSTC